MSNSLFEVPRTSSWDTDTKYSRTISVPQYLPSNCKPKLWELCDKTKYRDLLRNINTSDIPEEDKEFLRIAAARHVVFNYEKIADYYAHSDDKLQKLMEESALVIIDINDAIMNGYVRLSKRMEELIDESKNLRDQ